MVLFKYTVKTGWSPDWPKSSLYRQDSLNALSNILLIGFETLLRFLFVNDFGIAALIFSSSDGHISRHSYACVRAHCACMLTMCWSFVSCFSLNVFRVFMWLLNRTICYTFLSFIFCAFSFSFIFIFLSWFRWDGVFFLLHVLFVVNSIVSECMHVISLVCSSFYVETEMNQKKLREKKSYKNKVSGIQFMHALKSTRITLEYFVDFATRTNHSMPYHSMP